MNPWVCKIQHQNSQNLLQENFRSLQGILQCLALWWSLNNVLQSLTTVLVSVKMSSAEITAQCHIMPYICLHSANWKNFSKLTACTGHRPELKNSCSFGICFIIYPLPKQFGCLKVIINIWDEACLNCFLATNICRILDFILLKVVTFQSLFAYVSF